MTKLAKLAAMMFLAIGIVTAGGNDITLELGEGTTLFDENGKELARGPGEHIFPFQDPWKKGQSYKFVGLFVPTSMSASVTGTKVSHNL